MTTLIIAVLIVLLASALCSGTEAALFSTPILKVKQLAEAGQRGADNLLEIRERMNRPIAMIVIMNNIANIVGSMVIGSIATNVFGSQWIGVFSAVLTFLVILFSEIIPKTVGEQNSEKISLAVAKPVLFLTKVLLPVIWVVEKLTAPFDSDNKKGFSTNEKEIRYLAQIGEEEGAIEEDELSMIQGVFQLNDRVARDIMTPRVSLTSLAVDQTLEDAKEEILASQHSRIVVTGETRDDVRGIALRTELLAALVCGDGGNPLVNFLIEPVEVSHAIQADELLPLFQHHRQHLAIVRDEFNGLAGVVTLEDVIEELTGEIVDETDEVEDMRAEAKKNHDMALDPAHQES